MPGRAWPGSGTLEARCCQGDPYFLPVVEALRRQGKTLGLLSDMYLEKTTVQGLVEAGRVRHL